MAKKGLGIGAVARMTGIPAPTLRTWELRYGKPSPERTPGGQRVYAPETVEWLRLVQAALDRGLRAAQALEMDEAQLRGLLGATRHASNEWMDAAVRMDAEELERCFLRDYTQRGAMSFVVDSALPFLAELGDAWVNGQIGVHQEHLASGRLAAFLSERWRPLAAAAGGAPLLLVGLPREQHTLGLDLAALVLASAGRRVVMLGALPAESVGEAVAAMDADAVIVSVSSVMAEHAAEGLNSLRAHVPEQIPIFVGGAGGRDGPGIEKIVDFGALKQRLAS